MGCLLVNRLTTEKQPKNNRNGLYQQSKEYIINCFSNTCIFS